VVVPMGKPVQLLVTSEDVIHEWSVPKLGIKADGVPGRLNEEWLDTSVSGTFTGGATLTSGASHEAMTIEVRVIEPAAYAEWQRANLTAKGCGP
jgi:cytochrome c oxidase subunit II